MENMIVKMEKMYGFMMLILWWRHIPMINFRLRNLKRMCFINFPWFMALLVLLITLYQHRYLPDLILLLWWLQKKETCQPVTSFYLEAVYQISWWIFFQLNTITLRFYGLHCSRQEFLNYLIWRMKCTRVLFPWKSAAMGNIRLNLKMCPSTIRGVRNMR